MQTCETHLFLKPPEGKQPQALTLFQAAMNKTLVGPGLSVERQARILQGYKPYVHFVDFLHEQGSKPLPELTGYASFLQELLSKGRDGALDLVELVPNTIDTEHQVWKWFIQKARDLSVTELLPFIPVLAERIHEHPVEIWELITGITTEEKMNELLPLQDVLVGVIRIAGLRKPRKHSYHKPVEGKGATPEEFLFDQIRDHFLQVFKDAPIQDIQPWSQALLHLNLYREYDDETLSNFLRQKIDCIPFDQMASIWELIKKTDLPGNDEKLIDSWDWFVEHTKDMQLSALGEWIPFVISQQDRGAVAKWFLPKAKLEDPTSLHPWAGVTDLLESSSDTQGLGVTFFLEKMSHLPLSELRDWKVLFDMTRNSEDVTRLYKWLSSKLFSSSGTMNLDEIAQWQDMLAQLTWRADPILLEKMVSDVSEVTDTIPEWQAIEQWISALVHHLHDLRNPDDAPNTPGHETSGRKAFLFLWQAFTTAVGDNPENAHRFGSLLETFINNQGTHRFDRRLSDDESEFPEDFDSFVDWIQKQLTPDTRLHGVDSWQHLFAKNKSFFDEEMKHLFSQSTLEEVRGWRSHVESAVETMFGGDNFTSTESRIDLLVQFAEEVSTQFGDESSPHFAELYVVFRDFVMLLRDEEVVLLHKMARMKGVLNHSFLNLIDGTPFALELPKTGGRLFIWSEGASAHGATITNMMTPVAYRAWKKAYDVHVPVPPIVAQRELDERIPFPDVCKDLTLVDTRPIGISISSLSYNTSQKLELEIARQKALISKKLSESGITYAAGRWASKHNRDHNYFIECIERSYFEENGGWECINTIPYSADSFTTDLSFLENEDRYNADRSPWVLVVRLIDWDHAFLQEEADAVDTRFYPNHDGSGFDIVAG